MAAMTSYVFEVQKAEGVFKKCLFSFFVGALGQIWRIQTDSENLPSKLATPGARLGAWPETYGGPGEGELRGLFLKISGVG